MEAGYQVKDFDLTVMTKSLVVLAPIRNTQYIIVSNHKEGIGYVFHKLIKLSACLTFLNPDGGP